MAILDDTRADWNARPPLRTRTVVQWSDRIGVSWHWIGPGKGPSATGPHSACLAQVRDWQAQHQANGWKDIGYNALVCQHARTIEGRGLTFSGSHSPGVNASHIGIQFMVGEGSGFPTPPMIARAQRLRADIGHLGKNVRRDWSHRDDPKASTECAGDAITKWVHSGGPTATQEEDDMPLTDADIDRIWAHKAPVLGSDREASMESQLQNAHINAYRANREAASVGATVAAQAAALALLAKGSAVDIEQIKAAINQAVSEFEVTLAVKKDPS